ncbi:MAG: Sec-dependent nitrous-oxide reductase, partial [Rhizobiaceae bacterium]
MRKYNLLALLTATGLLLGMSLTTACKRSSGQTGGTDLKSLMQTRHLTDADVSAALKTYVPPGQHDPYLMLASGGHSGHLVVLGLPSMRILRYVGVFTPEPWQGYGFDDDSRKMLQDSSPDGHPLTWGDMHHVALSQTNADYDGQFVFVNDKANARVAVVNLKDFATTQIVRSRLIRTDHGSAYVTPNTDYVIESGQYPATLDGSYQPLSAYNDKYRGAAVFWKFDRQKGRIDTANSFAIELPPYMQELAEAGRFDSDGWAFFNSFNTERATGGDAEQQPPLEAGASQNDMDYLHLVNWRKAAQLVQQGKAITIRGMKVLPLKTAIAEGVLYFVPEPRSPHGVDVTPDGKEICVSGKLDTHVTVYSFQKILQLIRQNKVESRDPYGIPVLPFKDAIRGQVQAGLGPLHTQFDGNGYAYTSLFIESAVVKWNLKTLQVESKIPIHFNIGHLIVAGGDTAHPDGHYLIADNKWTIDRFDSVGPKEDPNFELIDISQPKMQMLYNLPIPLGEPHYGQIIRADKIKALPIYTMGYNVATETDRKS